VKRDKGGWPNAQNGEKLQHERKIHRSPNEGKMPDIKKTEKGKGVNKAIGRSRGKAMSVLKTRKRNIRNTRGQDPKGDEPRGVVLKIPPPKKAVSERAGALRIRMVGKVNRPAKCKTSSDPKIAE